MISEFHFIRPLWLCSVFIMAVVFWFFLKNPASIQAWREICDSHLLNHLLKTKAHSKKNASLVLLLVSVLFMIIGLAGPSWTRISVPNFRPIQPRILLLDMSDSMLQRDLSPDRLIRAKFKLHDLFQKRGMGQFGLIVYTGEAFIVSPLTEDGQTIDALLSSLTTDIMPVAGNRLDQALVEAGKLIEQAGFHNGEVLVLTPVVPDMAAVREAKNLASQGIHVSLMPMLADASKHSEFKSFTRAGDGELVPFSDTSKDIDEWMMVTKSKKFNVSQQNDIPVWRDEGRWFVLPAVLLLLPFFRRGWLQRVRT